MKLNQANIHKPCLSGPEGIRTPVFGMRTRDPGPLDDGTRVAGRGGLEPPLAGPEPAVLPLDDLPLSPVIITNWPPISTRRFAGSFECD